MEASAYTILIAFYAFINQKEDVEAELLFIQNKAIHFQWLHFNSCIWQ